MLRLNSTNSRPAVVARVLNSTIITVSVRHPPGNITDTPSCMKSRHVFGFLGFTGFALVYAMRVNLSVAIVSMVNQTAIPHSNDSDSEVDVCPKVNPVNTTFVPVVINCTNKNFIDVHPSNSCRVKENSPGTKRLKE